MMKSWDVSCNDSAWQVLGETTRSQAVMMTVMEDDNKDGPIVRLANADQWLYVVGGNGEAIVNGITLPLWSGTLVLIEAGDSFEIRSAEGSALRSVSFFMPPMKFPEAVTEQLRHPKPEML